VFQDIRAISLFRGFGLLVLLFLIFWQEKEKLPTVQIDDPIPAQPREDEFVYALETNQTLGDLFNKFLNPNDQDALLSALRVHIDPRRVREGTTVRVRSERGGLEGVKSVEVTLNADEMVQLLPSTESWNSRLISTPTTVDTIWASGNIESSLWNSLIRNQDLAQVVQVDREKLVLELNDVFKWQVDFVRQIQAGDSYRFAFEREIRSSGTMRTGHVLAAELINQNRSYTAVWFDPNGDGEGTYYDLDGKSVKGAFLLSPIELRHRISSRFTTSRFHPILKTWRAHRGVDYAAPTGTPVQATGNGVIVHRARESTYGNRIDIQHPNGWTTRYAHMNAFARGFSVGSRIKQGDIIGYVGMTGLATGPHLHYEMLLHGRHEDPLGIDLPSGDPVPNDQWDQWQVQKLDRLAFLDELTDDSVISGSTRNIEDQSNSGVR
jgi:murein DD-endopeptidase MepM/ murein hydrolase activator NlpD|tara:strand:+ start:947 stop:2254 length:1308 start_codon:yes stop_codon:yes gene_type:complete